MSTAAPLAQSGGQESFLNGPSAFTGTASVTLPSPSIFTRTSTRTSSRSSRRAFRGAAGSTLRMALAETYWMGGDVLIGAGIAGTATTGDAIAAAMEGG